MPRPKQMHPQEVATWLAVLLDTAFDPGSETVTPQGKAQLLALASDFTNYPEDFPHARRAELLLLWVNKCLPETVWPRLQSRVRKRRVKGGVSVRDHLAK